MTSDTSASFPRGLGMHDTPRASILVVDDRADKHIVYRALLQELGQEVISVTSGEQALKNVLERDFAVILLDVNMPGLDGLETAALIRKRRRSAHVPIIFITADYGDEERTTQAYALGAVDFLVSPIVPQILRTKVRVFVDLWLLGEQAKRRAEEQLALAQERAARGLAERANARSAFLARASVALSRSLALPTTIRELARLAVPFLADVSALTIAGHDGVQPQTELAWIGVDGDGALCTSSVPHVECKAWRDAIEGVLATGRIVAIEGSPDPVRAGVPPEGGREALEVPEGAPVDSLIIFPLIASGRTLGALSLGARSKARRLDSDLLSTAGDLADRAAMALDNAQLYGTIRENDRRKNEFLAMLSHELRNPLAPILNALHIMDHSEPDSARSLWAKQVVGRQIRQLSRLVDDLLDVSRITQGRIELKIEAVDVARVVSAAAETAQPLMDARHHEFVLDVPAGLPRVRCDFARLAQVLANLLNNAAKYTDPNGRVVMSVAVEGMEVVFRIRDTGVGIPAESLSAVFELFAQSERTLDRSQGGLGVGLTLAKRLVELQAGSITAYSAGTNQGSEFAVRLPAASGAEAPPVDPASPGSHGTVPAIRSRVLVVDDNRDAAQTIAVLLRLAGHDVRVAHDGHQALRVLTSYRPDTMLLDVGLPGIDGYELAERIRSDPGSAGVLLVAASGYAGEQDRSRAAAAGFDRYLVKPVDPRELNDLIVDRVRARLEDHRSSEADSAGMADSGVTTLEQSVR